MIAYQAFHKKPGIDPGRQDRSFILVHCDAPPGDTILEIFPFLVGKRGRTV
jgi:hypothetical protein